MSLHGVVLFLITTFNAVSDQWTAFCSGASKVAKGFWYYFTGMTNKWYFLPGATTPIPATYYDNRTYGIETANTIGLEYDETFGLLTYRPLRIAVPRTTKSLPWLSASLTVNNRVFDIDNWARSFRFDTISEDEPSWFTPRTFVSCWSIDSNIWPVQSDNVFLNVIDTNGTPFQFSVCGNYDTDLWLDCLGDEADSDSEDDETVAEEDSSEDDETVAEGDSSEDDTPVAPLPASPVNVEAAPADAEAVPADAEAVPADAEAVPADVETPADVAPAEATVTETSAEAAPVAPETPAEAAPVAPETPAEAAPVAPETPVVDTVTVTVTPTPAPPTLEILADVTGVVADID